jgi:transposase
LRDEKRSGRPVLEWIDSKIIACLDREPFHSAYSIAEAIGVSHTIVLRHLEESLGMKNFYLRWIPYRLTDDLRQRRVSTCEELLPLLETQEQRQFRDLVTGDESWFTLEYEHQTQWQISRQEIGPKVRQGFQTKKFMLTVLWGNTGLPGMNLMPSQRGFNSEYFLTEIMQPLLDKNFPEGRLAHTSRLIVHLSNCRVHFSKLSQKSFDENSLHRVPQPPYSPDITQSDFWFFDHMKSALEKSQFKEPEDLLEAIIEFLKEIHLSELMIVFHH